MNQINHLQKNNWIKTIEQSDLKKCFNPETHWSCSLEDTKTGSVWICLMSQGQSSLRYLSEKKMTQLRGVLIEIDQQEKSEIENYLKKLKAHHIPYCLLSNLRENLAKLAFSLYGIEEKKIPPLIGITGTNGKTSIAIFSHQIYQNCLKKHKNSSVSFYSGTLGIGIFNQLQENYLTSPDIVHFCFYLSRFIKKSGKFAAIELSSHALAQERLKQIDTETAVFSNITQDHFDYHKNFSRYFLAKQKLIEQKNLKNIVINLDDSRLMKFAKKIIQTNQFRLITTSSKQERQMPAFKNVEHLSASSINLNSKGIHFFMHYWNQNGSEQIRQVQSSLFGQFNVENLLLSTAAILSLNNPLLQFDDITKNFNQLQAVKGRMQKITSSKIKEDILFFVDYAHSPDALKKTIQSIKIHFPDRYLISVFGAGGGRDFSKRAEMGSIVYQYSDSFIITSDNSRNESFEKIANDIKKGFSEFISHQESFLCIQSRNRAIDEAINQAIKQANNQQAVVVLVAGKGHENIQVIGDKTLFFSDIDYLEQRLN